MANKPFPWHRAVGGIMIHLHCFLLKKIPSWLHQATVRPKSKSPPRLWPVSCSLLSVPTVGTEVLGLHRQDLTSTSTGWCRAHFPQTGHTSPKQGQKRCFPLRNSGLTTMVRKHHTKSLWSCSFAVIPALIVRSERCPVGRRDQCQDAQTPLRAGVV